MKREIQVKSAVKTKYRRKIILKDRDLDVVIFIPISPEEHDEEQSTLISGKETTIGRNRVLELYLTRPIIKVPTNITFNISKDLSITTQAEPFNYVFLVKYTPKYFTKVALSDIKKY